MQRQDSSARRGELDFRVLAAPPISAFDQYLTITRTLKDFALLLTFLLQRHLLRRCGSSSRRYCTLSQRARCVCCCSSPCSGLYQAWLFIRLCSQGRCCTSISLRRCCDAGRFQLLICCSRVYYCRPQGCRGCPQGRYDGRWRGRRRGHRCSGRCGNRLCRSSGRQRCLCSSCCSIYPLSSGTSDQAGPVGARCACRWRQRGRSCHRCSSGDRDCSACRCVCCCSSRLSCFT